MILLTICKEKTPESSTGHFLHITFCFYNIFQILSPDLRQKLAKIDILLYGAPYVTQIYLGYHVLII